MENLLQGIVNGHKETQKKLDEQTDVLKGILNAEKLAAKAEAKRDKRESQAGKRQKSDKSGGLLAGLKKEAKKDKKGGILGALLGGGGIGSIVKLLVGSKLLIAGLATVVGGAIFAYIKNEKFRKAVNTLTSTIWDFTVKNVLTPGWEWIKEKGPEAYKWIQKNLLVPSIEFLKGEFYKILPDWMKPKKANSASEPASESGRQAQKLEESIIQIFTGRKRGEFTRKAVNSQRAINEIGFDASMRGQDKIAGFANSDKVKDTLARAIKAGQEMDGMQSRVEQNQALLDDPNSVLVKGSSGYQAILDEIGRDKTNAVIKKKEIEVLKQELKNLKEEEKKIKQEQRAIDEEKGFGLFGGAFYNQGKDLFGGFQKGGHVNVPGQGSGDKVPMMLPGGSFVMNRNASMMLQQGGMVPTLLEPGEKVFGPGQWGPMEQMMNSTFGRFQEGGQVGDTDIWNSFLKNTTPKPDPKAGTQPKDSEKQTFKPGTQTKGPVAPGGHLDFIGDGSGFTGELRFIDGKGKTVGSYGGVSGTSRGAGSTQEQRKTISGQFLPLPDGSYPIESPMGGGSSAVGSFAAWINNTSGAIGKRSELFLHNDIGSNGTAGCIGTELGGMRGPNTKTNEFTDLYNKVAPKKVNVGLGRSDGKAFTPGNSSSSSSGVGGGLGGLLSGLGQAIFEIFGDVFGDLFGGLFGPGDKDNKSPLTSGTGEVDMGADINEKLMSTAKLAMAAGFSKSEAKTMAAIAGGESSFNNRAHNPNALTGDNSYGLWQINMLGKMGAARRAEFGISSNEDLYDPLTNAKAAKKIYDSQGFDAWGAYTDGNAAKYTNAAQALKLQKGGVANVKGGGSYSSTMVSKSQEQFAQKIADAVAGPTIIPVPTGGGGGGGGGGGSVQPGNNTNMPMLQSNDSSVMAMEYKYRITMGASV